MRELNVMIIGAGTMGSEIALAFSIAGFTVWLLDLPEANDRDQVSQNAVNKMTTMYSNDEQRLKALSLIQVGNIRDDLRFAEECEWIIEVVPEQIDMKAAVFRALENILRPNTIISSNTSGISIAKLKALLPERLRSNFVGTHFFNPPTKNRLVELIPSSGERAVFNEVRTLLTERLNKTCIESADVPNFIVNRFAFFFIMETIEFVIFNEIEIWQCDKLSGEHIGRPKTATFGLLDLIGLDVWLAICANMGEDQTRFPLGMDLVRRMVSKGHLGRKSGDGFYDYSPQKNMGRTRPFVDIKSLEFNRSEMVERSIEAEPIPLNERMVHFGKYVGNDREHVFERKLVESMIEAGTKLSQFAPGGEADVDTAIKLGLGHQIGPFELGRLLSN